MFDTSTFGQMVKDYYSSKQHKRLGQFAINHYLREWNPELTDPELFYETDDQKAINIIIDRYYT